MSGTSLVFVVPPAYVDVADEIAKHYGSIAGLAGEEREDIAAFLSSRIGDQVEVEFDDDFNDNPVLDLAGALDRHETPYFGYWPSYEERSRRDRFDGGYVFRLPGDAKQTIRLLAWSKGDPTPLEQDMRNAGFEPMELSRISEAFYAPREAQHAP